MENFKASFIRLSSLSGFANSKIANDLKNIELQIMTDESSIHPIELKSQMMNESLENSVVSHSPKLKSTQLLSSSKSNAEQPSSPAILVDLSAESVICQNSISTGHLPRPAFPQSIEPILGSEASGNREAETNKQVARENRHALDQYEKHEKSLRINSAVDHNTAGTDGVILIPDRSKTQVHKGMNNTATRCSNLQFRNPTAAAVSNTLSQNVRVTLPLLQNLSAVRMSQSLPFLSPHYTTAHSHLPKPTPFVAPYLASTYRRPPFSINPTVTYSAAAAAAARQQTTNAQAVFNLQDFCPSDVGPFCSGLPESQVQHSSVPVPPYVSSTCFDQSVHSNESQPKSPRKTNRAFRKTRNYSEKPLSESVLDFSLKFYKDTKLPYYDVNAVDKRNKVWEAFNALTSGRVCVDKKCSCAGKKDVFKEEIMQGSPLGLEFCRFNHGECNNYYSSKEQLYAHVVKKHRESVEFLHPDSNTHYCEVCWAIFATKGSLDRHRKSFNHVIDVSSV